MSVLSKCREQKKIDLWAGISLVGVFCFMLFFYAPLELYFYNQSDFWFDWKELLPLVVGMFLLGWAAASLVMFAAWIFCPRFYQILLPCVTIAFLCTYIQGNFLVGNLPVMDGSDINWEAYSSGRIQSVVLWVVVTVIVLVGYRLLHGKHFAELVRVVSLCMMLMFGVTLVSILFTTKGYEQKLDACATIKDEYEFSDNENFIILVLDSIDAAPFYEVIEENEAYQDIFEDFTYYANTLGAYPYTMCSVPFILSGEWYENDVDFEEYNVGIYKNSSLFASLEDRGYRLGMYEFETPYLDESIYRFTNVMNQKSEINSYFEFAKLECKLVGFRYAPFDFKKFCRIWPDSVSNLMETNLEYPAFKSSNLEFFERIHTSEVSRTQENCFKFIHVEGSHVPYWYDKDMNLTYAGDYRSSLEASLTLTKAYLQKLKEAGVYDNSVIIVMADHGTNGEYYLEPMGRQNPILFVKGIGEQHAFEVSQAPVSYADLQTAFQRLLDGNDSREIFDYHEGDERQRRYIQYAIDEEEAMYEYVTIGHASDDEAMTATGNTYFRK